MSHMKKTHPPEAPHKKAMLARTKLLRESVGLSQEKMAEALDVPLDRYRKYESRTLLLLSAAPSVVRRKNENINEGVSDGHWSV